MAAPLPSRPHRGRRSFPFRKRALPAVAIAVGTLAGGCGSPPAAPGSTGVLRVVAGENEYGDVARQIGGDAVTVTSVETNPNVDPHTYEVSADVARKVAGASLVIQNGLGYDSFLDRIEAASSSTHRKVVDVQALLHLPDSTPNPHLWYAPTTMPVVAAKIGADLSALEPSRAAYFRANVARFDASLQPWQETIASFAHAHPGAAAAVSEPVADYLLQAMGVRILTPFSFQAAVMNGNDPSPQQLATERQLLTNRTVQVFAYNQQVVDALTSSLRADAGRAGVPVVGVYETMPTPGYTYQSWMLAETRAIERAVVDRTSTAQL